MSQKSNAGSHRTDGGLANTLGNLIVGHQPRPSEHLRSDKATVGELQRHIGRMEEKIEHNKVLLVEKDREIADLHQANKEVHDDLAQHKARLRKVETEKQLLLQDIGHLHEEVDGKAAALKKLNDDLVKAQKTIKVQSDQIAGPKDGSKTHTTPQRFNHSSGSFSQVYNQPPPVYNASTGARFHHPQPVTAAQHTAPILRRQSSNQVTLQPQSVFGASSNQTRPSVTPTRSFNSFQSQQQQQQVQQQGVLVLQSTDPSSSATNLIAEFTPFFHSTETWAHNYTSLPDQQRDQFISDNLRDALALATEHPRTAMKLLSSSKTRPLLVARVINQLIVDFAFRPLLLRGFTPYHDSRISSYRGQLLGPIPSHVRRALLLACAETVTDMTQAEGFDLWMQERNILPRVHETWHLLTPLFAHGTPRDPAWTDLNRIWHEATRIGLLMLSKPCIYTLDFPPAGSNSYFNPSNMCYRDEGFGTAQDPQTLGGMAVSVRLAITPIVTETDFMKEAIEAKCLHQAMVLLSF